MAKNYNKKVKYIIMDLDIENATKLVKDFFEKRPTKDVYEKCLHLFTFQTPIFI